MGPLDGGHREAHHPSLQQVGWVKEAGEVFENKLGLSFGPKPDDGFTGGLGLRTDHRQPVADQGIEERGFSDVGAAGDRDSTAFGHRPKDNQVPAGLRGSVGRDGRRCGRPANIRSTMNRSAAIRLLGTLLLLGGSPAGASAQVKAAIAAQAIAVLHRVNPTAEARPATAVQVIQPVIMTSVRLGRGFSARGTINLEGLTIPGGELTPGAWGEGFVDRRHPHTFWHELVVEGVRTISCGRRDRCRVAAFLGKGFVPFGSADPMVRPFVRYPVNHHLAQILERAVVGVQFGIGPATFEGALFNGDEPERPGQWPRIKGRFGDSWSLRATYRHRELAEAAVSIAGVTSPEHRPGAGSYQKKRHVGLTAYPAGRVTIFGEWARTSELDGFFEFDSWLAEAEWRGRRLQLQYRFEATERPEEERLSPFRSARPHLENSILGVTQWTSHTLGATFPLAPIQNQGCVLVFAEVTTGRVRAIGRGLFDLTATYGRPTFSALSLGLKFGWGDHSPMGRYGLTSPLRHRHGCG